MELSLDQKFTQLEIACKELETSDELREAECKNIATILNCVRQKIASGVYNSEDVFATLSEVIERLNFLAENPDHAGRHEIHRDTVIPQSN